MTNILIQANDKAARSIRILHFIAFFPAIMFALTMLIGFLGIILRISPSDNSYILPFTWQNVINGILGCATIFILTGSLFRIFGPAKWPLAIIFQNEHIYCKYAIQILTKKALISKVKILKPSGNRKNYLLIVSLFVRISLKPEIYNFNQKELVDLIGSCNKSN